MIFAKDSFIRFKLKKTKHKKYIFLHLKCLCDSSCNSIHEFSNSSSLIPTTHCLHASFAFSCSMDTIKSSQLHTSTILPVLSLIAEITPFFPCQPLAFQEQSELKPALIGSFDGSSPEAIPSFPASFIFSFEISEAITSKTSPCFFHDGLLTGLPRFITAKNFSAADLSLPMVRKAKSDVLLILK